MKTNLLDRISTNQKKNWGRTFMVIPLNSAPGLWLYQASILPHIA
jgi:hypothetical protein